MAIDTDQIDEVREALAAADSVDPGGIRILADGDVLVLRGSVATFEEVTAAQQIAEERATQVRNELLVDHNLRETGGTESSAGDVADSARRDGLQGSSYDPLERADDVVSDVQEALDENRAWDPPHEAVEVPTRAESRGVADRRVGADAPDADQDALLDEDAGDGTKSLPDLSSDELSRAAHPERREEDST